MHVASCTKNTGPYSITSIQTDIYFIEKIKRFLTYLTQIYDFHIIMYTVFVEFVRLANMLKGTG